MMNAATRRRSGDDPDIQPTHETTADRQPSPTSNFDARDRLRGEFDDTTVRQAVLGTTPHGDTTREPARDTAGEPTDPPTAATH